MRISTSVAADAARITAIADVYQLNALAFAHPHEALHRDLSDRSFQRIYDERLIRAGFRPAALPLLAIDFARYEAAFIRLFQVGGDALYPCSLYETDYELGDDSRGENMVRLTQFYRNFGLRIAERSTPVEQPDHLTCELEMMTFLAFRQAHALVHGGNSLTYRMAQRDFLERRLGRWLPALAERVANAGADPFLASLVNALTAFTAAHETALRQPHAAAMNDPASRGRQ